MTKRAPPFAFFWLHVCLLWPTAVIALALGNRLRNAGLSVGQVGTIIAASHLAYSFEIIWGPGVDASATRQRWFIGGATLMSSSLTAMLVAPWNIASAPWLTLLAFLSSLGGGICGVAAKGLMAYNVPATRLATASMYYTAGGILRGLIGASALWLLTHAPSRPFAAAAIVIPALLAGAPIVMAAPERALPLKEMKSKVWVALLDLWALIRTPTGALAAVLCVIPFGVGTEAGLMGAIAPEWSVSADQLALLGTMAVAAGLVGAMIAGWLSTRVGPWSTYIVLGWCMVVAVVSLAATPRVASSFFVAELIIRALSVGCYAALLCIVMTTMGKGAAATKAAALWGLANFAAAYPTIIDGRVHDRAGVNAMLLTDACLQVAGFTVLLVAARLLGVRVRAPITTAPLEMTAEAVHG